jgi:hypothetical protein
MRSTRERFIRVRRNEHRAIRNARRHGRELLDTLSAEARQRQNDRLDRGFGHDLQEGPVHERVGGVLIGDVGADDREVEDAAAGGDAVLQDSAKGARRVDGDAAGAHTAEGRDQGHCRHGLRHGGQLALHAALRTVHDQPRRPPSAAHRQDFLRARVLLIHEGGEAARRGLRAFADAPHDLAEEVGVHGRFGPGLGRV